MSTRLRKSFPVIPALVLLGACASGGGGDTAARPSAAGAGAPSENATVRFSGQILSTGTRSIRGSAGATTIGSATEVVVSITGGQVDGQHPWHVHRGTCGSNGPVVGAASAYPVLRPDSNGGANETANLSVALSPGVQYYVNIHESPQNPGNIVACAELSRS